MRILLTSPVERVVKNCTVAARQPKVVNQDRRSG